MIRFSAAIRLPPLYVYHLGLQNVVSGFTSVIIEWCSEKHSKCDIVLQCI